MIIILLPENVGSVLEPFPEICALKSKSQQYAKPKKSLQNGQDEGTYLQIMEIAKKNIKKHLSRA